ncbi:MAG TPA: hypothetical protein VE053_00030 [Allosphingosinicella sp.]|nr:hypothetical protein [Allosphingosinicella sp.]
MTDKAMESRPVIAPATAFARPSPDRGGTLPGTNAMRAHADRLDGSPRVARQRQLAAQFDNAPSVVRLHTLQRSINSGQVVQAMFQEPALEAELPQNQPAPADPQPLLADAQPIAADQQAQPAVVEQPPLEAMADQPADEVEPPEFAQADIAFSSRGAENVPIEKRSVYFGNGRRIRLSHPHGPEISDHVMERFTFRPKPAGGFYGKADYQRVIGENGDPSTVLKPAEIGDAGKLFEIGDNVTHPSRGRPVVEDGIPDQAHLDGIAQVARAADLALAEHRATYKQAKRDARTAERARRAAERLVESTRAQLEQADPGQRAQLEAALQRRTERLALRQQESVAAHEQYEQSSAHLEEQAAPHNEAMRLAYINGPAALPGAPG